MPSLNQFAFRPDISGSSSPSVVSTAGSTAQSYALQSTALREWQFVSNRAVLVTDRSTGGDDAWITFGTSDLVAASTGVGIPFLGGTAQVITIPNASVTHFSIASSTTVVYAITLGYGF